MALLYSWCLVLLVPGILGDIYLHNPRGSNNRLNENSAQRQNGNRLFDSQNNNRGGYNVGDATSNAFETEDQQFRMTYFQSSPKYQVLQDDGGKSFLPIEWTNQHGCGGDEDTDPHKVNCNIVFQYMCQEDVDSATGGNLDDLFRNGKERNTQTYQRPQTVDESKSATRTRKQQSVTSNRGFHESFEYYDDCYVRERNNGLFKADQNLKRNGLGYTSGIHTRQNGNGDRSGFECPEERDYFPYWHPTPWKDIAILAVDVKDCSDLTANSFNSRPYHRCIEYYDSGEMKPFSRGNTESSCDERGGQWTELYNFLEKSGHTTEASCQRANSNNFKHKYIWAIPHDTKDGKTKECLVGLNPPECKQAPWSRTNHLGNGRDGTPNSFTWTLPHFPSGNTQRCVLRARYNISSDDYNPHTTDSNHDEANSPVSTDPFVEVGGGLSPLKLAVNTAQFGRTFQDRSHVFKLKPRTQLMMANSRLYNLNVRGKRGNIVQTFPAVEYDFFPNDLKVKVGDLVHIQWEGSNTHKNKNPAGDGQSGDAGQGASGTDRHNLAQIYHSMFNYPVPMERADEWKSVAVVWNEHGRLTKDGLKPADVAIGFATSGYYDCHLSGCDRNPKNTNLAQMDADMNNAPASYAGAVLKMKSASTFYYMSTRNNAFTNRSQKGKITVVA